MKSLLSSDIPPLNTLRGFEATARLTSLQRAAQELHITPSAVRHQISTLEQHLNVNLFTKHGRNIKLTKEGQSFYKYVTEAFSFLKKGIDSLSDDASETLRLHTYITASMFWLIERLPDFSKTHPDVSIQLQTCGAEWEFDSRNADVGIVFCSYPPPQEYYWKPLFWYELEPVCSPGLLEHCRTPNSKSFFSHHPLLNVYTERNHWEQWLQSAQIITPKNTSFIHLDNLALAIEMALQGHGIALTNGPFSQSLLFEQKLVRPFNHSLRLGHWGCICKRKLLEKEHVRDFIDWLTIDITNWFPPHTLVDSE